MGIFDFFKHKTGAMTIPLDLRSISLLQPEAVIGARASVDDISSLANRLTELVRANADVKGASGLVAGIIVKPGGVFRVWCETVPDLGTAITSALEKRLNTAAAPAVSDIVAFAMHFARGPVQIPPIPRTWRELAGSGQPVQIPEGIVAVLWPNAS